MSSISPVTDDTPRARVSQVAKVLGVEPAQLVRTLAVDDEGPISIHAWLDGDRVASLVSGVEPKFPSTEAARIVALAFAGARGAKADWKTMTLAVLKNRLIAVTDGAFDETDYGAPRMVHFAQMLPRIVSVGERGSETFVTLMDEAKIPDVDLGRPRPVATAPSKTRVRADLWNAVMDFKSGTTYVWNQVRHVAEPLTGEEQGQLVIPTVNGEIFDGWRMELIDSLKSKGVNQTDIAQAQLWAETRAGSQILPMSVRGMWNALQNDYATARLRDFFSTHNLGAPDDLAVRRVKPASASPAEKLRAFLRRCIDVMTGSELEEVQISAAVALRASTQHD